MEVFTNDYKESKRTKVYFTLINEKAIEGSDSDPEGEAVRGGQAESTLYRMKYLAHENAHPIRDGLHAVFEGYFTHDFISKERFM